VTPLPLERAIRRGTRTATGEPGSSYWQNSSDYDIRGRVSPADSLVQGSEEVLYHNHSPDTLSVVVFHLYQNLFGPEAAREDVRAWDTRGMVVDSLAVGGTTIFVPDNDVGLRPDTTAARVLGTLMMVPLPRPLLPGDSLRFHVRWHFTIPPTGAGRMFMDDRTTAQVAQWYPQIAVYDDIHGWDREQYTGTGEFYLDYGRFRMALTLPAGFVVGGTGTLQNPEEVLTDAERERLGRATPDTVIHVVTSKDFGAGTATRGSDGQELTWRFEADSVRDVAFAFSDHYLWDATRAVVDSASGRSVPVNVLYRPNSARFHQVPEMARSALETHSSRMVPYPYPQLTETEGGSGGMEYPMIVFVEAYHDLYGMDEVSAHEIGHEWFPMLVGSNETRYGWQDEGLNTFDTFFATDAFLPDSLYKEGLRISQRDYLYHVRTTDEDLQIMSPANSFDVLDGGYGTEAYDKPSAALWVLREILGDAEFYRAYRTYIRRWSYRHPTPWDFFNTFTNVTGRPELEAFFEPWFFGRDRLDQAVESVEQNADQVVVTVRQLGGLPAPVDLTAHLADGTEAHWREPFDVWLGGDTVIRSTHRVDGTVTSVVLDAAGNFPDVDPSNDRWTGGGR